MTRPPPARRTPRIPRLILRLLTWRDQSLDLLRELDAEYGSRVNEDGPGRAWIWYWRQVISPDLVRLWWAYRGRAVAMDAAGARPRARGSGPGRELLVLECRQALRSIRGQPLLSAGFVGLLALCVATATVVLSLAEGILLRPAPYPDPDAVVLIGPRWLDGRDRGGHVATAEYLDVTSRNVTLAAIGAIERVEETLITDGPAVQLPGSRVTASALEVLGVPAEIGRTFFPEASRPGGADVVLLSHALWQRVYGGSPDVLGTFVRLGDRRLEVVGVMPDGFVLPTELADPDPSLFFLPLVVDAADPGPYFVKTLDAVVGRMRTGISEASVRADVERIASQIVAEHPDNYRADEWTLRAYAPLEEAVGYARSTLRVLIVAVAFLVLAVCANLAGMLASRAEERRASMAVRAALGAGRSHLVRCTVLEALLLAAGGGVVGAAVSAYAMPFVKGAFAGSLPRIESVEFDLGIAAGATGAALLTALLFSLRSTLQLMGSGQTSPVGSGPRVVAGGAWFRRVLIGGQLAVASVLLYGGLLLGRSLLRLVQTDPGFEATHVQTVEISVPSSRYASAGEVESFFATLLRDVGSAPGIESVGLARRRPMADRYGTWTVAVRDDGEPRRLDDAPPLWQVVTPGYFRAMSIAVEEGRIFTGDELAEPAGVIVVNRAFERAYWPARSAVGTAVRMDGGSENPWLEVIGVVADVSTGGPREPAKPVLYVPHPHFDEATSVGTERSMTMVVRTTLDVPATHELLQSRVSGVDPLVPMGSLRSMDDIVSAARADTRVLSQVLALFGALALGMGALGVYVTLAQEVSRRTRELGVRAALGAGRATLIRDVVSDGILVAAMGVSVGLVVAYLAGENIAGYLFGIPARDLATFLTVALVLLAAAAAASYVPARRAARADPVTMLRAQ